MKALQKTVIKRRDEELSTTSLLRDEPSQRTAHFTFSLPIPIGLHFNVEANSTRKSMKDFLKEWNSFS
jgi:hypothetical protein